MSLPAALGGPALVGWRLTPSAFAPTWDDGEGAFQFGGRWNSKGVRAVYCSLDAATATLEVAVHAGFRALDTVAHTLIAFEIADPGDVLVVHETDVPNTNWLTPATPSAGQQTFGDGLLKANRFVAIRSAVSKHSWNLLFIPSQAAGRYAVTLREPFALDTRLHPSA